MIRSTFGRLPFWNKPDTVMFHWMIIILDTRCIDEEKQLQAGLAGMADKQACWYYVSLCQTFWNYRTRARAGRALTPLSIVARARDFLIKFYSANDICRISDKFSKAGLGISS